MSARKPAAVANNSVKVEPVYIIDQCPLESTTVPDIDDHFNANQNCYKKKDNKNDKAQCGTGKACDKCGADKQQCTCAATDTAGCKHCGKTHEGECCCGKEEPCGSGNPPGQCCDQQNQNANMNKLHDVALGREELLAKHGWEDNMELEEHTVGPDGQCGERGDPASDTQQTHNNPRSARNTLTRVKNRLKRFINHKPVKIKVLQPNGDSDTTNTNVNKTPIDINMFFSEQSGATCPVVIKRLDFPSGIDNREDKPVIDLMMENGPLQNALHKDTNSDITPVSSSDVIKSLSVGENSHGALSSMKSEKSVQPDSTHNTVTSSEKNPQEVKSDEESAGNKIQSPENSRALAKQGTFIIEKPKLAWSSPVLRFKCGQNELESQVKYGSPKLPTLVTSLQLIHGTFDTGTSDVKDGSSAAFPNDTPRLQDQNYRPVTSKLQVYSDPVMEELTVSSATGLCLAVNEIIASDESCDSSDDENDKPSITQHKNDSLAWVIVSKDKNVPGQDQSHTLDKGSSVVTSDQCVATNQTVPVSRDPPVAVTNQKKSRFKKLSKTLAIVSNNITGSLYNMLPSSSIFTNRPRYGHSKGGKPEIDVSPAATIPEQTRPEGDASIVYETVTMKHATTLTIHKKVKGNTQRLSRDSFQKSQ